MAKGLIENLYKEHYHTAYIYTFSLCKNKELTEDIVSEAFEKALLTIDKEKKHFKYWLLVVCKNCWLDHVRKQKREFPSEIVDYGTVEPTSVLYEILKKEKNRVLLKGIMQLPKSYQEIVILHYYADIPLVEIEGIMNLSKANTKTLISRARRRLKQVLEEMGYEF